MSLFKQMMTEISRAGIDKLQWVKYPDKIFLAGVEWSVVSQKYATVKYTMFNPQKAAISWYIIQ